MKSKKKVVEQVADVEWRCWWWASKHVVLRTGEGSAGRGRNKWVKAMARGGGDVAMEDDVRGDSQLEDVGFFFDELYLVSTTRRGLGLRVSRF
jgi:hypothetical protein